MWEQNTYRMKPSVIRCFDSGVKTHIPKVKIVSWIKLSKSVFSQKIHNCYDWRNNEWSPINFKNHSPSMVWTPLRWRPPPFFEWSMKFVKILCFPYAKVWSECNSNPCIFGEISRLFSVQCGRISYLMTR